MHKTINSKCICKKNIMSKNDELLVIMPCQHIIHLSCLKYINNNRCKICNIRICNILTFFQIIKYLGNKKKLTNLYYFYSQLYIDMYAVQNVSELTQINYFNLIIRLPNIMRCLYNFNSINPRPLNSYASINILQKLSQDIFNICNIKIKIYGRNNIKNIKKVIICNHITAFDPLFLFRIFKCGFLGSHIIKENWIGNKLSQLLPLLLVKRGQNENNVEKIKKFINDYGSICLFPEGLIHNQKTLIKFRTGGFMTGYPVQPVIINIEPFINDYNMETLLMKVFSQNEINVTIKILPIEYPKSNEFNKKEIELIRQKMAQAGNLYLSRISNKDIKD